MRGMVALLGAGLLSLTAAAPARADADSVLVRVGGELSSRQGSYVDVPVTVDLSGAPGRVLGSYRAKLSFNPAILQFQQANTGNFAAPSVNSVHASDSGQVLLTAVLPGGASGVVTIFVARFYVNSDTAQSPISVNFDEMSATATSVTPFESLLSLLRYVNGTFCRSLGRWGDVDGDGFSNSRDALIALSVVVGMAPDTVVYDTTSTDPLTVDTTVTMRPSLADVDADGKVTSRDALIILSYAVGLPVTGYRVLLPAAGACATGTAITLVIAPDSLELQVGQDATVLVTAHDAKGRAVPTDTLTWVSSNPSVAVYDPNGGQVVARGAGVTTLTAQLGPGVTGTLKVSVLARRTTWYVAVEQARNAPTQLGTQTWPLEFIGDALSLAHDGDTVRVAGGVYEEVISASVAVVLLGDSVNRPVIDPRGAPNGYSSALNLEPNSGLLVVANLVVRAGTVYLSGHDIAVRNVVVSMLGGNGYAALELIGGSTGGGAPPARGPQRGNAPAVPGSVFVDGVVIAADSTGYGILVDLADTAVIRNSTVTRASAGNSSCYPGPFSYGGILVRQASVSTVRNNVATNSECQGIGVFDYQNTSVVGDIGRATISQNRVTGASGTGIAASARVVALDHNSVRNTVAGYQYNTTEGIHVTNSTAVDSVSSLADTVVGVRGYLDYGLRVDTAVVGLVDSLSADGVGTDTSYAGSIGVYLEGGRLTLAHSRISNTHGDGVQVRPGEFNSRGNVIRNSGSNGLLVNPSCECSVAAADSVSSVRDSVLGSSNNGIEIDNAAHARVDSAFVDSAGNAAIAVQYSKRATVTRSVGQRAYTGIDSYAVDTISVLGDTVRSNTNGVYVDYAVDSVTIRGSVADANSAAGIFLDYQAMARIDSSVVTNNLDGLYMWNQAGARVRWSRFQDNGRYGIWMDSYANVSSKVDSSTFMGNVGAGARNDAYQWSGGADTLFADTNYWGHPNGPSCDVEFVSATCLSPAGDSIITRGITFSGWLGTAAPTPAPRMHLTASRRVGGAPPAASAASRGALPRPTARAHSASASKTANRASASASASQPPTQIAQPRHRSAPPWHRPSTPRTSWQRNRF